MENKRTKAELRANMVLASGGIDYLILNENLYAYRRIGG